MRPEDLSEGISFFPLLFSSSWMDIALAILVTLLGLAFLFGFSWAVFFFLSPFFRENKRLEDEAIRRVLKDRYGWD